MLGILVLSGAFTTPAPVLPALPSRGMRLSEPCGWPAAMQVISFLGHSKSQHCLCECSLLQNVVPSGDASALSANTALPDPGMRPPKPGNFSHPHCSLFIAGSDPLVQVVVKSAMPMSLKTPSRRHVALHDETDMQCNEEGTRGSHVEVCPLVSCPI